LEASGTTTIFVTHDIADAVEVADKIAVLDSGKLLQYGSPKEIYESPKTRNVARLFGDIFELEYAPTGSGFQFGSFALDANEKGLKPAVRLENIRLHEDNSGQQKAVVTLTKWAGAYLRIQVETASGKMLTVQHDKPLDPGTAISLSISDRHIFWIKAS
jgi:ABC-type Fe3+/spermidine/putrescine transport system ATPase subunit